ncbi:MAG: DUF1343 domain-containing protein [Bacteroidales bacterium]|nr:DUF1343 domain-containing protein [Bacteroidales bacterium]
MTIKILSALIIGLFSATVYAAPAAAGKCCRIDSCAEKSESATCCQDIAPEVTVGAARTDLYIPLLKGKRVALFSNHTGMVGDRHTLDVLLDNGVNVTMIFSPEHGFRGTADAGEHVSSGTDPVTGIRIASLYDGKKRGPSAETMDGLDIIVVDIQDVGLRYYTYYCTMIDLMNAAAGHGKKVMVLDRPNPNGMYVDGPVLDMTYASGVGRLPIPVVHGMTLAELAQMANGEGWLKDGRKVELVTIPCAGYTHSTRYRLPIAPSPNLRDMKAIYLYPATCYFEATPVSLGRGTEMPFLVYGHPDMTGRTFTFIPRSVPGAKNPPQLDRECHGVDLRGISDDEAIARGVDLTYIIDAYNDPGMTKDGFFRSFFEKLIGRGDIRTMIEQGKSAEDIKATWAADVARFKEQRRPYLLYAE